jgi:hypothetical protein
LKEVEKSIVINSSLDLCIRIIVLKFMVLAFNKIKVFATLANYCTYFSVLREQFFPVFFPFPFPFPREWEFPKRLREWEHGNGNDRGEFGNGNTGMGTVGRIDVPEKSLYRIQGETAGLHS